ncbi:HlyD family secretion protein [Candidatus Uabimicrobium sp. HlEnr_7]|uniref:HlyD family secretion protein n=1 Tax=Candidatus Uabimicrobium helgolandensis TaxID=3095367 RepID=UPI003558AD82
MDNLEYYSSLSDSDLMRYNTYKNGEDLPALRYIKTPKVISILSKMFLFGFISLIIALIFTPWVQNVTGKGEVIAYAPLERRQTIAAPIFGVVTKWYAEEGELVEKNQLLVEISDNDPQLMDRLAQQKTALKNQLVAAKSKLESYRTRYIALNSSLESALAIQQSEIQAAIAKRKGTERELDAQKANFTTSALNYKRVLVLKDKGITSQRDMEVATLKYQKSRADVNKYRQELRVAKNYEKASFEKKQKIKHDANASMSSTQSLIASSESDIAKIQAEIAKLSTSISRQSTQVIKAPRKGYIFKILKAPGSEQVKKADAVAIFLPYTQEKAVEIYIDGNDIPLVSVGRKVRLKFEGWPALQFVGWPSAAVGTFGGEVAVIDSTDSSKGKFRIVIVPDKNDIAWPDSQYLRQGVRVVGWVLLDEVSLGFELWRQFNGFPPSIEEPDKLKTEIYKKKK